MDDALDNVEGGWCERMPLAVKAVDGYVNAALAIVHPCGVLRIFFKVRGGIDSKLSSSEILFVLKPVWRVIMNGRLGLHQRTTGRVSTTVSSWDHHTYEGSG